MRLIEAVCETCSERFTPFDEADTEHAMREDGQECGGTGRIDGTWTTEEKPA